MARSEGGWFPRFFFFSSRRRHTRYWRDWSSDVCSSDLAIPIFNDDSMKIGIAGGTGGMGEGFALRWCQKHDVIVGSRDAQKATEAAENYTRTAKQTYGNIAGTISGIDNISFANDIDVLILSIPYEFIDDTCGKLAGKLRDDCIVVSPIVPMARTEAGFVYIPLEEQDKEQAAEMVADTL